MKKLMVIIAAATIFVGCQEKEVVCPTPYYGEHCNQLPRDKFIGNWFGIGGCSSQTQQQLTITTNQDPTRVNFDNGFFGNVDGQMVTIPNQTYYDPGANQTLTVYGNGSLDETGNLFLTLTFNQNQICTFTMQQ